jgi:hypothetical protein
MIPQPELDIPSHNTSIDCPREPTWPEIYFWFTCIALNSYMQPSGQISGLPYAHASLLRASPFLRAFDAVNIIVSWISRMAFAGEGPRESATRILAARFPPISSSLQSPPTLDETDDVDPIARLEDHRSCRYTVFFLGILPQCIKFFASSGLLFLQFWGAMYLTSWVLVELLVLAADTRSTAYRESRQASGTRTCGLKKYWGYIGVVAHILGWGNLPLALRPSVNLRVSSILSAPVASLATVVLLWGHYIDPEFSVVPKTTHSALFWLRLLGRSLLFLLPLVQLSIQFIVILSPSCSSSAQTRMLALVVGSVSGLSGFIIAIPPTRRVSYFQDRAMMGVLFCTAACYAPLYLLFHHGPRQLCRPEWVDWLG